MEFAICIVAAAPVRKEPSHRSEMISQLLFGETMEIVEVNEEWFRIRATYDRYEGWVTYHLVNKLENELPDQRFVASDLFNRIIISGNETYIPMASSLSGLNEQSGLLWNDDYKYEGAYVKNNNELNWEPLFNRSIKPWIHAPYLWGGRTFMGVDCSGFVQNIFKVIGVPLNRDACLQAEQGSLLSGVKESKTGDLAFFSNEGGKIIHVGIVLDNCTIIHSSGKVRIDDLNESGIINRETKKRTHELSMIRRLLP